MTSTIRMWDLAPSPNNKKVRLALGYKGISYDRIPVSGNDRSEVVRVSGQPLTPVIKHGETVIFDSSGILRYLEANVKREPRLFSADYAEMSSIEKWEDFARTKLRGPVGTIFNQFFSEKKDGDALANANREFNAACRELESALNAKDVLVGSTTTAADITCAAWVSCGLFSSSDFGGIPLSGFFAQHMKLDPERARLRKWYDGVNRYDR
jgi:glutathione S-transferase